MFNNFKYLVREGLRNMWANRLMSLASIGVLVCCLVLMGSAILVSLNLNYAMKWLENQNVVMVFLKDTVSSSDSSYTRQDVEKMILSIDNVDPSSLEYVSKTEGYDALMKRFDKNDELMQSLGDISNVLPNAYKVSFKDQSRSRYDVTIKQLEALDVVYTVRENREYAQKLEKMNETVSVVGVWIVGLLLVVSLFIITNTIKLTMYVRKLEITIMKSVGATDWFIRMPFLVEGIAIGVTAGLISFGLVSYSYSAATSAIYQVMTTGALPYSKIFLWLLLAFLGAGVVSGAMGSLVSIGKYLKNDGGLNDE